MSKPAVQSGGKSALLDALTTVQSPADTKSYKDLEELPDGMTTEELAVELNKGDDWVKTRLKALSAQGKLVIGKKRSRDLSGRDIFIPAYKIKE